MLPKLEHESLVLVLRIHMAHGVYHFWRREMFLFIYFIFFGGGVFKPGFLSLDTIHICGQVLYFFQVVLYYGIYPMHCRMFSSTPGLYLLDPSSSSLIWWPEISPGFAKCPLEGKSLLVESYCFKQAWVWCNQECKMHMNIKLEESIKNVWCST